MYEINDTNLVEFVKDYFSSLGITDNTISDFFGSNYFDRALILKLSAVCIIPKNKPTTSSSKQTHIHVTGFPRYFFFNKKEADNKAASTDDKKITTDISLANIKALKNSTADISTNNLEISQSFTLAKISHRDNQSNQVQISKIALDGSHFIDLRLGLYENDLLVFSGYKSSDKLLAVGIPKSYYSTITYIKTTFFTELNYKTNISIRTALKNIESSYDSNEVISDMEVIDDSIYQQQIADSDPSETHHTPMPKTGKSSSTSEHPKRNAARGKEALKDGQYICGLDSSHLTFVSKTGLPYVEAHHLIPMSREDDFTNSLDVKGNIVPLCPNCHSKIHYGQPEEVSVMIEQLYNQRKDVLTLSVIEIDLESLKQYYS